MKIWLIAVCGGLVTRPTRIEINTPSLLHNLSVVKQHATSQDIIAMVKANAYGCGIVPVVRTLLPHVQTFGVACLEEAYKIKDISIDSSTLLLQGVFEAYEWQEACAINSGVVIHHINQLRWLLEKSLPQPITIWIKVDTGMHRLGFNIEELEQVIPSVISCPWVRKPIGIMSHFARADEEDASETLEQLEIFNSLQLPKEYIIRSVANSAAILSLKSSLYDVVRPGIMLYGSSPFPNKTAADLNLQPVMQFTSRITAIHNYPAFSPIGYGGIWQSSKPAIIGIIPVGYADGYPRVVAENTPVWVKNRKVPIVGRISMDMMTVDLTDHPGAILGDEVELWGNHIPVETIAKSANTISYELLTKVTSRPTRYCEER